MCAGPGGSNPARHSLAQPVMLTSRTWSPWSIDQHRSNPVPANGDTLLHSSYQHQVNQMGKI